MLQDINSRFVVQSEPPTLTDQEQEELTSRFPTLPDDYFQLLKEGSNIMLTLRRGYEIIDPEDHDDLYFMTIFSARNCLDMAEAEIAIAKIPNAVVVGSDGGGSSFIYMDGDKGWGLYLMDEDENVIWLVPSLRDLLVDGIGIETTVRFTHE